MRCSSLPATWPVTDAPQLHYRRGTEADVDLVFEWANDQQTRAASFHPNAIPHDSHVRW